MNWKGTSRLVDKGFRCPDCKSEFTKAVNFNIYSIAYAGKYKKYTELESHKEGYANEIIECPVCENEEGIERAE